MTCCLAAFAIGDSFYASLYVDDAYWFFFALAIPLVMIMGTWKWRRILGGSIYDSKNDSLYLAWKKAKEQIDGSLY